MGTVNANVSFSSASVDSAASSVSNAVNSIDSAASAAQSTASNVASNVNNAAASVTNATSDAVNSAVNSLTNARDQVLNAAISPINDAANQALDAYTNISNMPVRGIEDLQSAVESVGASLSNVLPDIDTEKILGLDFLEWDLERAIKNLATTVASYAAYIAIRVAALAGTSTSLAGKETAGGCILAATGVIAADTFTGTGDGIVLDGAGAGGLTYTPGVDEDTAEGNVLKTATATLGGCTKAFQVASSFHSWTQIVKFIAHIGFLVLALAAMVAEFVKFFAATAEKMDKLKEAAAAGQEAAAAKMSETMANLAAITQQLQANVNVLAAASISPVPMNTLIKSLGYSTSSLALSTPQQIAEAPVITPASAIITDFISTDQLVIPGVLIGIESLQLPIDLTRKLQAEVTTLTTPGTSTVDGVLTLNESSLNIPDNAKRGILSSDVKVCKMP
jgi:hypothetical protein